MISVVLPVYNPGAGWADNAIAESLLLCKSMPRLRFEFIMVNDGSTSDLYHQEKHKIMASHIRLIEYSPNQGKGEALRRGVAEATGELIIYTDIDFPYTQESIRRVIDILLSGQRDVVIGIKDRDYYAHVPAFRRYVSKMLRFFVRLFFRIPTDDFMCGLKGFSRKAKPVFLQTGIDRYLFDLEFMFLLSHHPEITTTTEEIHLKENIQFRKMNPQIIRTELRDLFRILIDSYRKR